ncbi:MAG: PASTA domain-containing protein [Microthrixaceae bacterium]
MRWSPQDPEAGELLEEGGVVEVTVSSGIARVEMPDAVGRPLAEVVGALDEAAVDYTVDRAADEQVARGVVISQEPEAGVRATAADEVVFVVSEGPEPRPVPGVAGLSPEGAAYALGLAGFEVEVELREDAQVRQGVVIGTEPGSGSVEERDSPVLLVVSSGPPSRPLPDLVGRQVDDAVAQLRAFGLVPNVVGAGAAGGVVRSTEPAAATPVGRGDMIVLEVTGG